MVSEMLSAVLSKLLHLASLEGIGAGDVLGQCQCALSASGLSAIRSIRFYKHNYIEVSIRLICDDHA